MTRAPNKDRFRVVADGRILSVRLSQAHWEELKYARKQWAQEHDENSAHAFVRWLVLGYAASLRDGKPWQYVEPPDPSIALADKLRQRLQQLHAFGIPWRTMARVMGVPHANNMKPFLDGKVHWPGSAQERLERLEAWLSGWVSLKLGSGLENKPLREKRHEPENRS